MKFSINRILIAAFMFLSVAFLFSCQKQTSSNNSIASVSETDTANYSNESAQADGSFDDVDDVSMAAADAGNTASIGRMDREYHPDFSLGS